MAATSSVSDYAHCFAETKVNRCPAEDLIFQDTHGPVFPELISVEDTEVIEYFAYGSNLNLSHLRDWLGRFGVQPDGANNPRRVVLLDYRLRTNYLTTSKLGAANIESSPGEVVEGLVFTISTEALEALRAKEGWPHRYDEIGVEVVVPRSRKTIQAVTYMVTPQFQLPIDVPVSARYRALILEGARVAHLSPAYQSHLREVLLTPMMFAEAFQLSLHDRAESADGDEGNNADRRCA
jgi:hypothetical protein